MDLVKTLAKICPGVVRWLIGEKCLLSSLTTELDPQDPHGWKETANSYNCHVISTHVTLRFTHIYTYE